MSNMDNQNTDGENEGEEENSFAAIPFIKPVTVENTGPPKRKIQTWLISFTDVMALMLTFFVLLFAMSNPKQDAWTTVITALDSEFNKYFSSQRQGGAFQDEDIDRLTMERTLNLNYLEALLERMVTEYKELQDIKMTTHGQHITISIPGDLLFPPGSAEISERGRRKLYNIGSVLGNIMNPIEIEGHTDPEPVSGGKYSSNWELSLDRAVNVALVLSKAGYAREIKVRGMADGQFQNMKPALPQDNRYARARRVDIIISGQ